MLILYSSSDPILTAFELSWELRRLSRMETEFRTEYNVTHMTTASTHAHGIFIDLIEMFFFFFGIALGNASIGSRFC